jgi:hypothetical protein
MRIVDREHHFAALRVEGANLAVVPAARDHGAVARERNRRARLVRYAYAEQLLVRGRVPDANVFVGARGEQL